MKIAAIACFMTLLCSCASTGRNEFVYFPDLADKVLAGDKQAFRQVLAQADITEPGDRIEELAEIASRFVRISPKEFLRGESDEPHCFGVAFLGPDYADNPGAREHEFDLRRTALQSVDDPSLLAVKQLCLAELIDD